MPGPITARVFFAGLAAAVAWDVLQERKVPRTLDRCSQLALLACRAMGLAAGQNLATLIKAHLETLDVLVVDNLVIGEDWLLAAAATTASARPAIPAISRRSRRTFPSGALSEARALGRSALGRLVRLLVVHTCKRFSLCIGTITRG
jgi:hypothetical protein